MLLSPVFMRFHCFGSIGSLNVMPSAEPFVRTVSGHSNERSELICLTYELNWILFTCGNAASSAATSSAGVSSLNRMTYHSLRPYFAATSSLRGLVFKAGLMEMKPDTDFVRTGVSPSSSSLTVAGSRRTRRVPSSFSDEVSPISLDVRMVLSAAPSAGLCSSLMHDVVKTRDAAASVPMILFMFGFITFCVSDLQK